MSFLARAALGVLIALVVLIAAGAIYQRVGLARDARSYPPPGEQVDIGGRRLHLYCVGENVDDHPTVILETLSGGLSPYWAWVQPELAQTTRVCAYDRAGRGWSDPDPEPRTLARTVTDLHTALQVADEPGPYVLVGHSIGGNYVRRFAADYPQEVVGIVLVDAAHPEQFDRFPEMVAAMEEFLAISDYFPLLTTLGVFRLYFAAGGEIDFQDLPARQHAETEAFLSSANHWRSAQAEGAARAGIYHDAQALGDLGDLPLAVVTAGHGESSGWRGMQEELAQLSSNSLHVVVEDAQHASLAFNETHAQQTSAAIRAVVTAAATGQTLAIAASER
jgi:pimeloyl-ACP methyl ester carboxylesterase